MVTWIVVGAIVLGLLLLVVVVLAVISRVRPLAAAGRRLQLRGEQAARLQAKVATLQETMAGLEAGLAETAAMAERVGRHRRGE